MAGPAHAAAITGNGEIDFTDHGVWGSANGSVTASATLFDNVRVTLSATGGTLTTNSGDHIGWAGTGVGSCNDGFAPTMACGGDGIGISDDEITGISSQILTVEFSTT